MTNRVDQILEEIRSEVERRKAAGDYPQSLLDAEKLHAEQLGTLRQEEGSERRLLQSVVERMDRSVAAIVPIERDASKMKLVRIIRELAMSRHQLRRLHSDVLNIAEGVRGLAHELVRLEDLRVAQRNSWSREMEAQMVERSLLLEQLVVLAREMDDRISGLEHRE